MSEDNKKPVKMNCGDWLMCPALVKITKMIEDRKFRKNLEKTKKRMEEVEIKDEANMALSDEGRLSIAPYLENPPQVLSEVPSIEANETKQKREFDDLDWLKDETRKQYPRSYFEYMHGYPREFSLLTYKGGMLGEYPKCYVETNGNVVKLRNIQIPPNKSNSTRSEIVNYSHKSRKRLRESLQAIDWSSIEKGRIAEITLTYHNNYKKDGKEIKNHLNKLIRDLIYNYSNCVIIWKMEYQKRGAPHFHLIMITEESVELGDYLILKKGSFHYYDRTNKSYLKEGKDGLRSYIQMKWNKITEEDTKNFNSGIEVEPVKNPTGLPHYLVKYVAKEQKFNEKDYQHSLPEWIQNAGRWWGIRNKDKLNIHPKRFRISPYTFEELIRTADQYWRDKGLRSYNGHEYGSTIYFNSKAEIQKYIFDVLLDNEEMLSN